jgi:hypothetical protein
MRRQTYLASSILAITLLLSVTQAQAAHKRLEREYQNEWCGANNGAAEIPLPDKTRVDCLTKTNAIEFDFAPKFYEALGQSLWYALNTNKKAGIVLILESLDDNKYWIRLNTVIKYHKLQIDVWKIENF